ncbi:hypothetical protein JCM19992_07460 [Thermostilla marina]
MFGRVFSIEICEVVFGASVRMPRRRHLAGLSNLFDKAAQPIYVLDAQWRIVYANRACLDWVSVEERELLGRRCLFHSELDLDPADVIAAGLCPPPEAMTRDETIGSISCLLQGGKLSRRRARFLAIRDGNEVVGLIALADPDEQPVPTQTNAAAEGERTEDWHEVVRALRHELRLVSGVEPILGRHPASVRLRRQIEAAAAVGENVLLYGRPGSGRRTLAATIHYGGGYVPGPLIPIPCADIDADVLETTVQALAAAHAEEDGRAALLLEDVDALADEAQWVLQRLIVREDFPFRLFAVAESSLLEKVEQKAFRAELALVLTTLTIRVPPLEERLEDVPVLAQALLERWNTQGEKQLSGFSPPAIQVLTTYRWPGEFAELQWAVEEAARRARGPRIEAEDLPRRLRWAFDDAASPPIDREPIDLPRFLADVEREVIMRALRIAKGNKAQAARLLGLNRPRLYRRLAELGIDDAEDTASD